MRPPPLHSVRRRLTAGLRLFFPVSLLHPPNTRGAPVAGAINSQPAVARAAKLIGLNWNDIHPVGISRVHDYGKTEIRGHSIANVCTVFGTVVRAIQSPMILQEDAFGTTRMHRDFVYTLPELGVFLGHERSADAPVLRGPGMSAIVGPVNAAG